MLFRSKLSFRYLRSDKYRESTAESRNLFTRKQRKFLGKLRRMDISKEFLSVANNVARSSPGTKSVKQPHSRGIILARANEAYCQLCSFQSLLHSCYDAYVGYHRYIGDVVNKRAEKSLYFSESERLKLRDETVHFMSGVAIIIQELSSTMDDMADKLSVSRLRFYQSIISDLMHKLNDISKLWDFMQKEQVRMHVKPCRLFASFYQNDLQESISLSINGNGDKHKNTSKVKSTQSTATTSANEANDKEDAKFAERYIDEIAPPAKMREYQAIAEQQRAALFKETQTLQTRFSEDLMVSMQLEKTVMSISKMVTEFASLLESQAPMVEDIGEVAKDVKASMRSADEELLVTLERTQSQNWNMIILIFTLSGLLLLLHFITP